ncbi:hypothetical protein [Cellulomonas fimi]|uniref:Phage P2 LysB-like protein n=1 Tax=Cellulomonas fimi (strain ATCC 484 / DSM 20113 / JCM 1341 / CCUG 24087 / LMG 16345 / NBRC 15513 / NCIMB 8980 / NCTC 7547 / NRS-133) TaxID=590998 RepID=F4H894_CELFA|nr:hypothetical protein [Cellulomonas fimi]AEE44651.1 phage P2 LysB-like protein [Cellulomonas fimi ATCC 484]NNH08984.1 hypothetical protein [Cellulomonas fimi]VEH26895.1 Uncharacterised protein [Cellulomonas fimi]
MTELWGPALDAELAFRREQIEQAAHRGAPARPPQGLSRPAAADRRTVRPAQSRGAAVRGWLLRGSGAWHVAR